MQALDHYIKYLEKLAAKPVPKKRLKPYTKDLELATNGQLYKQLREDVPIAQLHASGAFFTGERMAADVVAAIPDAELATVTALDPTCGGGNLLLALARRLPLAATLADTLTRWGQQLYGMDIHLQFVRATRARLFMVAVSRGLAETGPEFFNCPKLTPAQAFPNITKANSLECDWPVVARYLLNPPFNRVPVPKWYKISVGKVSQAALFVFKYIEQAPAGSIMHAILPDVLRSGTYYQRWRRHIALTGQGHTIQGLGQFDDETHVDVFLLTMVAQVQVLEQPVPWINQLPVPDEGHTIGQRCTVKVGRVVPHRDKEIGETYPYLDVHGVPPWEEITAGETTRKFTGTTFIAPFVVIRRNSRANDPHRAVGTLIKALNPEQPELIAVENHLLVVRPISGSLADCEALLNKLQDSRTDAWLNERIRCRHLTVSSIESIPWWPNG